MKRHLILAVAAVLIFGSASANASTIFQDYQDYTQIGTLSGIPLSATGTTNFSDFFDIKAGTPDPGYLDPILDAGDIFGYDPATMSIADAYVAFIFDFSDADFNPFTVRVDLGNPSALFYSGDPIFGPSYPFDFIGGDPLAQLQSTGRLDFTVTATEGSFYLADAFLQVEAVPEVSTGILTLTGIGCLGLFAFWRGRASEKKSWL